MVSIIDQASSLESLFSSAFIGILPYLFRSNLGAIASISILKIENLNSLA